MKKRDLPTPAASCAANSRALAARLGGLVFSACMALLTASGVQAHYMSLAATGEELVVGDNCQYFSLVIALAWDRDGDMTGSPEELLALQGRLAAAARKSFHERTKDGDGAAGARSISHGDLAAAVMDATERKYALRFVDVEPDRVIDTLRERTNKKIPQLKPGQVHRLGVDVPAPVLLAARRVDGQPSSYGHLIPVFSANRDKNPSLLVLLATARLHGDANQRQQLAKRNTLECQFEDIPIAEVAGLDYIAQLSWRPASQFEWHRRGQRVRVFWLERSAYRAQ